MCMKTLQIGFLQNITLKYTKLLKLNSSSLLKVTVFFFTVQFLHAHPIGYIEGKVF